MAVQRTYTHTQQNGYVSSLKFIQMFLYGCTFQSKEFCKKKRMQRKMYIANRVWDTQGHTGVAHIYFVIHRSAIESGKRVAGIVMFWFLHVNNIQSKLTMTVEINKHFQLMR